MDGDGVKQQTQQPYENNNHHLLYQSLWFIFGLWSDVEALLLTNPKQLGLGGRSYSLTKIDYQKIQLILTNEGTNTNTSS